MDETGITIRVADESDGRSLRRLAERDSADVPVGRVLLAERDSEVIAAVAFDGRSAIADPFLPTAAAVELLRVRTDQLRGGERRGRRRRRLFQLRGARPVRYS